MASLAEVMVDPQIIVISLCARSGDQQVIQPRQASPQSTGFLPQHSATVGLLRQSSPAGVIPASESSLGDGDSRIARWLSWRREEQGTERTTVTGRV